MPNLHYPLLGFLVLSACASTETQTAPTPTTPVQQHWAALGEQDDASSIALAPEWWNNFSDPQLSQAISSAIDNNFDLASVAARVQAVASQARAIAGDQLPRVNAGLNLRRSRTNLIGLPFPGSPDVLPITSNNHTLGLDLSWEIDLWGRLEANEQAAIASLEASDADYAAARLSLAGQTAKLWFARAEAVKQLELTRAQLAIAEEQVAYLHLRFRNGGPAESFQQAQTQVAAIRSMVPPAQQRLENWERQLAILMGGYPKPMVQEATHALPNLPESVPAGLPIQLVQRRPDLASAEAEVRAARARGRAANASLYPSLALTGSLGTSSNELSDLLDGDFKVWSLGAGLTAPLLNGGALKAQADASEHLAHAAELQFAQHLLRALAEVENSLSNEHLILQRKVALQDQFEVFTLRNETLENRYRSGVGDASMVYSSRAEILRAESGLLTNELLLLNNRIDLYLALGGGFQNPHQP